MLDTIIDNGRLLKELTSARERVIALEQSELVYLRTVEALRHSEERFRSIVDNSHDGIIFLNDNYQLTYVNVQLCNILGRSIDEVIGVNFINFVDASIKNYTHDIFMRKQNGDNLCTEHELLLLKKDGEKRTVELKFGSNISSMGRTYIVAQLKDITEKKITEEALDNSQKQFSNMIKNVPGIIFQLLLKDDNTIAIPYISESVSNIGLDPLKVTNNPIQMIQLINPDERQSFFTSIMQSAKNLEMWHWEGRMIISQIEKWYKGIAQPRCLVNKEILWDGLLIDITEQKKLQNILSESEEKYRLLIENVNEAIFVAQDNMLKYVNPKTLKIFGYTEDELKAKIFTSFIYEEDKHKVLKNHLKRINDEFVKNIYSFRVIDKAGNIKWVEINAVKIIWEEKNATLNFMRDITEKKYAEHTLHERGRELEAKSRNLEDANTALRVLLQSVEQEKKDHEDKITLNIKENIIPIIERLRKCNLNTLQNNNLNLIESKLNDILSRFVHRLSARYINLTPMELQIAHLIRQNKNTKEIASLLNLSSKTIESHRKNLRNKLQLKGSKINLTTHLLSIDE